MKLGAHQSIAGGFLTAIRLAEEDGCEALQVFTKVANQWREPVVDAAAARPFRAGVKRLGLAPVMSHVSYLVNLCSDDKTIRARSIDSLARELRRSETLGIPYVVLHPGAPKGQGEEVGLQLVAAGLDAAYLQVDADGSVAARVLLESTAGQGTTLGRTFEQLGEILGRARCADRLAFCLDTCHLLAAGYDWTSEKGYAEVFSAFDRILGLDRLLAFHLNDSKKGLGSHLDRHEWIGDGEIGLEPFRRLVRDKRFARIPGVLEIPPRDDERGYRQNLDRLRGLLA
ncbi:MAG: deoxyribonuclease IV [Deltaproteobacteria bacterium]|nr:deoxyribonuclease IV [Deltaproteobacteria bacterium]